MTTLNAADLTLVIKATNEASKALKSVEGHLQLIVTHPVHLDSGSSPE